MISHLKYVVLLALCFMESMCNAFAQRNQRHQSSQRSHKEIKFGQPSPEDLRAMPDRSAPDIQPPAMFMTSARETGPGLKGIDVSHYQGRINWDDVARDTRITFVILKATEANNFVDDTYRHNLSECKRLGIPVGSYHFYRANVDAESQFRNIIRNINPQLQDILPVIDVELTNGVSQNLFLNRLEELCDLVTRAFGERPIIYTGRNFFNQYFDNARWRHYKFWIAGYMSSQPQLEGGRDYIFWQYSDKGRVNGIRGDVDMNQFVNGHTIDDIRYHRRR